MSEPRETELKLDVEASDLARLREHPLLAGDWTETELTSVYYDTRTAPYARPATPCGCARTATATSRP